MLLHDTATLTWVETKTQLSSGAVRTLVYGVIPVELSPIDTAPATPSGPITIRYRLITPLDLTAMADAQNAYWAATPNPSGAVHLGIKMTLTYDGKTVTPDASFERHKIMGKFHHTEAVMKDFGFTGA